jgi:hypothetical protein
MMEELGRRILQNPDYLLKIPLIRERDGKATDRRDVEKHEGGDRCVRTEPHPTCFAVACARIKRPSWPGDVAVGLPVFERGSAGGGFEGV